MKPFIGAALLFCASASASWWIEPDDISIKADLQLLSDHRLVTQPLNTYPLMWAAIINELQGLKPEQLSSEQNAALQRLLAAWQQEQSSSLSYQLNAASDKNRFYSFGDHYRDKAAAQLSYQYSNDRFSGKVALGVTEHKLEGSRWRTDGSYLATRLGNWVISAGSQSRYWGPSWDTSLQHSQNARPIPGISLSRLSSEASALPLLNLIGPWTFTTHFSQLESDRAIPDAKLWAARATARPLAGLELGASWSMMWGGEGYGNGLSDWWNDLFNGGTDKGAENMLAGYDIRWSGSAAGVPYGLYAQVTAEDFHREKKRLINTAFLLGADMYLSSLNSRIYLEYADTKVGCIAGNSNLYNCLYEHGFHRDGYRYHGQSIGGTYDNDSLTLVAGIITPLATKLSWHNKLRWLRLNIDGIDAAAPGGNSVSPARYEQQLQWQSTYQYQLRNSKLSVTTVMAYQRWPGLAKDSRVAPELAISWEGYF